MPKALDNALQEMADQNHCGNKSAAIRETLYKAAGVDSKKLRLVDTGDAIANGERRAVKYAGGRSSAKKRKKK